MSNSMTLRRKLLKEGFSAFVMEQTCPYNMGTGEYDIWRRGWLLAFDTYINIEKLCTGSPHFYRQGCCIASLERKGEHIDWVVEEIYGPFINIEEAREWSKLPENNVENNPEFRYSFTPLSNPE